MASYNWEKGGGRDVVLNFIRTYNYGERNGYPKLNIFVNEEEKEYLQNQAEEVALHCDYEVDDEIRREKRDIQIFLEAIQRLNRVYRNFEIYN